MAKLLSLRNILIIGAVALLALFIALKSDKVREMIGL